MHMQTGAGKAYSDDAETGNGNEGHHETGSEWTAPHGDLGGYMRNEEFEKLFQEAEEKVWRKLKAGMEKRFRQMLVDRIPDR